MNATGRPRRNRTLQQAPFYAYRLTQRGGTSNCGKFLVNRVTGLQPRENNSFRQESSLWKLLYIRLLARSQTRPNRVCQA